MWWDPNGWSHQAYVCFLGWVKSGKQTGGILGEHLRVLGVPVKPPNKEAQASAEVAEGRARTKENTGQSHTSPAQNGHGVSQGLVGVRHRSI